MTKLFASRVYLQKGGLLFNPLYMLSYTISLYGNNRDSMPGVVQGNVRGRGNGRDGDGTVSRQAHQHKHALHAGSIALPQTEKDASPPPAATRNRGNRLVYNSHNLRSS